MSTVAWWPHTTDARIASFRLRCRQIVDALAARGVDARLHDRNSPAPSVLVLSKRYDRASLETALRLRREAGTRLVLDLCDNHFWYQSDEGGQLERRRAELVAACQAVDLVIVASHALADVVQEACGAPRIRVVPDAAEAPEFGRPVERLRHPGELWALWRLQRALVASQVPRHRRLVWFGNHGSSGVEGGMGDLASIRDELEAAHRRAPISLTVISNNRDRFEAVTSNWTLPCHYLRWAASSFSFALQLHSAAVIPIRHNPFTACKTANRVLSATLHGLNVLADRIPSYAEFSACCVLDDWHGGLQHYLDDAGRRARDLVQARALADRDYAIPAIVARWQEALATLDTHAPRTA